MNVECRTFRAHLASCLRGRASLTELSWHEHLLGCQDCRDLLEAEEALEVLLQSLPRPVLPAHLAQRVLARLEDARPITEQALDRLLELSVVDSAPTDLARRTRSGVEQKRVAADARLDRLLQRVPAPVVPAGLARDTLAALAVQRVPAPIARGPAARWAPLVVAAAALMLVASWWLWSVTGGAPKPEAPAFVRDGESAPPLAEEEVSAELLASLDVLEDWELLNDDELEVLLSSFDSWDEVLLDFEAEGNG